MTFEKFVTVLINESIEHADDTVVRFGNKLWFEN